METIRTGNKIRCLFVCLIVLGMSSHCVAGEVNPDDNYYKVTIGVKVKLAPPDYVACSGRVMVADRTLVPSADGKWNRIVSRVTPGNTLMLTIDRGTCDGYTVADDFVNVDGRAFTGKVIEHIELPANIYVTDRFNTARMISVTFWKRGERKADDTSKVPNGKATPAPVKTDAKTFLQKPLNLALLGAGGLAAIVAITQLGGGGNGKDAPVTPEQPTDLAAAMLGRWRGEIDWTRTDWPNNLFVMNLQSDNLLEFGFGSTITTTGNWKLNGTQFGAYVSSLDKEFNCQVSSNGQSFSGTVKTGNDTGTVTARKE